MAEGGRLARNTGPEKISTPNKTLRTRAAPRGNTPALVTRGGTRSWGRGSAAGADTRLLVEKSRGSKAAEPAREGTGGEGLLSWDFDGGGCH